MTEGWLGGCPLPEVPRKGNTKEREPWLFFRQYFVVGQFATENFNLGHPVSKISFVLNLSK